MDSRKSDGLVAENGIEAFFDDLLGKIGRVFASACTSLQEGLAGSQIAFGNPQKLVSVLLFVKSIFRRGHFSEFLSTCQSPEA